MAESLSIKVRCHACQNMMTGSAKYGKGHYVAEGLDFRFTAVGRLKETNGNFRVKGKVAVLCPNCEVMNEFDI